MGRFFKFIFKAAIVIVILFAAWFAFQMVQATYEFEDLVALGQEAEVEYGELNQEFEFEPTSGGSYAAGPQARNTPNAATTQPETAFTEPAAADDDSAETGSAESLRAEPESIEPMATETDPVAGIAPRAESMTLSGIEARAPRASRPSEDPRWAQMTDVRQRTLAAIPDALDEQTREMFAADEIGFAQTVALLTRLEPQMRPIMNANLEALREHRMSLLEYQWLLGRAVQEAVANPQRYEAGKAYRQVVRRILEAAREFEDINISDYLMIEGLPTADFIFNVMKDEYGGEPRPADDLVHALATDHYAAYPIDLLLISLDWGDAQAIESAPGDKATTDAISAEPTTFTETTDGGL